MCLILMNDNYKLKKGEIMKKFFVFALIFLGMVSLGHSQVKARSLGLRLGGGDVSGAEISYQHGMSNPNRLELDLGFGASENHNRIFLAGIYQWVWNLKNDFNWYAGPGASIGYYSYENADDNINIAVGGQIGIEYDFTRQDVPLLVSLDLRPMWDLLGDNSGLGWGVALGVRYIL